MAVKFVRDVTQSRVVVDPFCGKGTVLAAANHMGMDAIGPLSISFSSLLCRYKRWKHDILELNSRFSSCLSRGNQSSGMFVRHIDD